MRSGRRADCRGVGRWKEAMSWVRMTPTSAALSDTNFRKDHRKCAVLDVVEFLVEAGEEAEFCILG